MPNTTSTRPPQDDPNRELEFHREMLERRYRAEGLSGDAARAKAAARIGDAQAAARAARAEYAASPAPDRWLQGIGGDVRFAWRMLKRAPVFTATALATLAIGIGVTAAIFSIVDAVLLRPLPYPASSRIVSITNDYPGGMGKAAVAPAEFADYRRGLHSFDQFAAFRPVATSLVDGCAEGAGCEPERITAYEVSPQLFDLLGRQPVIGRDFRTDDGAAGAPGVVMLSDAIWQRRFGGDAGVLGRAVTIGGVSRTVIGVMPPDVRFPDEPVGYAKAPADIWYPTNWEAVDDERGNQYLVALARRASGVTARASEADLRALERDFVGRFKERYTPTVGWQLTATPLREEMIGDVRPALIALAGAVGLVLLIACANVANLLMARAGARHRELAVRLARGAGRRRLARQLLVETTVVTGIGAGLGVAVAAAALPLVIALNPGGVPRIELATINASVLLFSAGVALLTGLIVGAWPAAMMSRTAPHSALSSAPRGTGEAATRWGVRASVVVAEITLAVIVLVGSALVTRSFVAISRSDLGVHLAGATIAELTVPRAVYDTPARRGAFHAALRDRLSAIPGVSTVSAVYPLPLSGDGWSGSVSVEGVDEGPGFPEPHAEFAVAMPGYFAAAGVRLIEGRDFAETDRPGTPRVAVVDEDFARRYWPGRSPIGQRISTTGDLSAAPEVVIGVVSHVRRAGARDEGEGQVYLSAIQRPSTTMYYVARSARETGALAPDIRAAVHALDARQPLTRLVSGESLENAASARERFAVLIFGVFGLVALVLAALGLYGVMASLVAQRSGEIGIRLALGGRPAAIVRRFVLEGAAMAAAGVTLGLIGAFAMARALDSLLFGVSATNTASYAAIAALVAATTLIASYVPARRAARVDPLQAIRR
jgi:predicted permease